jgi:2-polyprenyl-3-methyl-5-hydroxy-6-metoxy-1,4-benzoquinol methylase
MFLSNPEWRNLAIDDLCHRTELPKQWFEGKKILDCGCGPGRHAWTFAKLGASVTAFDTSDSGLEEARRQCRDFPQVQIDKRNILDPLPYHTNFDLVWCYGVVHVTGDTFGALQNITRHLRPGGMLYLMVYGEPGRRDIDDYIHYHEIMAMRQAMIRVPFAERAKLLSQVQGEKWAQMWFDATSSQINDLYTVEELFEILGYLGFENIKRTALEENSLNITAEKRNSRPKM